MENLQVKALPKEFLLGAATAAYQVEGATRVDGKGTNMWDVYLQENSPFLPDPASDFYYRYEEDIALAAEHDLQALRLSISWVRIFPDIDGEPNILAVRYYHRVFQSCLKHNVIPFVSLHHFDSPQKMLETGDWLNRENIDRFIRYARFCFQEFNSTGIKGQSSFKLNALGEFVKKPGIPTTDWDWNIYPQGLFDMLLRIKEEYPQHPVIYLTENGTALKEVKPEGENDIIDDSKRIRYIEQHLHKVLEARDRGVNIQGYFIWSLQDQFSWANGYNKRYGLFFVDYETQKRYIKKSAFWVKGLKRN
ncbi:TPA: family 1 glycosylhydrolase [Streptococcus pneumoniae]